MEQRPQTNKGSRLVHKGPHHAAVAWRRRLPATHRQPASKPHASEAIDAKRGDVDRRRPIPDQVRDDTSRDRTKREA